MLTGRLHRADFDLGFTEDHFIQWYAFVGIHEIEKFLAHHAAFDAFLRERGLA